MSIPGKNEPRIAILGAGAVGGFLAAILWKKNISVTCVVKDAQAAQISESGIHLESPSFGDFTARPRAVSELDFQPDILFICVKAISLNDSLKRMPGKYLDKTVIVPLLNGIEHIRLLRGQFGKNVVAATIGNVELKRISPVQVRHTTPSARIEISSQAGIPESCIDQIKDLLESAGIICVVKTTDAAVIWGKLVRLNAIACTTAAADKPIGFIRSDPQWRLKLHGCVREAAAVALAEGGCVDGDSVIEEIDRLPETLGTSLQRDVAEGRLSELDAIPGAVLRLAKTHGIACPNIKDLFEKICQKQSRWSRRAPGR